MGGINTLQRHDAQQAAFVVLKAPDIPSVLVETAFITNPREEKLLASNAYQNKLASGILSGIEGYFKGYRPRQQMVVNDTPGLRRSEEHTSELQSLMRISYDVFCLKKKQKINNTHTQYQHKSQQRQ